jgi:hypothetical protein
MSKIFFVSGSFWTCFDINKRSTWHELHLNGTHAANLFLKVWKIYPVVTLLHAASFLQGLYEKLIQ